MENYPFESVIPSESQMAEAIKAEESGFINSSPSENGKIDITNEENKKLLEDYINMQMRLQTDFMGQQNNFLNPPVHSFNTKQVPEPLSQEDQVIKRLKEIEDREREDAMSTVSDVASHNSFHTNNDINTSLQNGLNLSNLSVPNILTSGPSTSGINSVEKQLFPDNGLSGILSLLSASAAASAAPRIEHPTPQPIHNGLTVTNLLSVIYPTLQKHLLPSTSANLTSPTSLSSNLHLASPVINGQIRDQIRNSSFLPTSTSRQDIAKDLRKELDSVKREPNISRQYDESLNHFEMENNDAALDLDEAASAELQTLDANLWKKRYELAQLELEATKKRLAATHKRLIETQKELRDYQQVVQDRNLDILQQAIVMKRTKDDSSVEVAQLKLKLSETEKKLAAVLIGRQEVPEKEIIID
uniref:Uncharacterized protein n=1 Tax=Acrobeloides nanus TaxID=290746 RepID=A0A914EET5_9BILA